MDFFLTWPFSARRGSTRGRGKVRVQGNVFGPIDPLAAPSDKDRYLREADFRDNALFVRLGTASETFAGKNFRFSERCAIVQLLQRSEA